MKKFLSIILAISMTFTVATSAYAVSLSDVDNSDKNVSVAEDNDAAPESLITFVKDLIKKIHNLFHSLLEKLNFDCLCCSDEQDDAT